MALSNLMIQAADEILFICGSAVLHERKD